ncbi:MULTISPECIES: hypothetical protein [Pseudomonas]|uniref:hypothetical protein n=1 Tax=Pseudomonas TaxID=286 RepID=UPI000BA37917|nr:MULTISPECIES: hypothetical protein [Pseudomonas]MDR9860812.1 hypothetical protein [Pseudomonas baetica]
MKTEQNKTQPSLKTCQLCGEEETGEISHIIPRLISKALAKESGYRLRNTEDPNRVVQDTLKLPFLGKLCEDLFEKYETTFAKKFQSYLRNPDAPLEIDEQSFRLLVSVCWRVAKYLIHANRNSPENIVHLIKPERAWRRFLLDETDSIEPFHIYLFLDRDFNEMEIKESSSLTVTHLRYEMGIGVNGYYAEKFTRQAVQAKLGPFIICGHMRDLLTDSSTEAEQWKAFIVKPDMKIPQYPRKIPASVVKAVDQNSNFSTTRLSTMSEEQKEKQREFADKNLKGSIANKYVQRDIDLFESKN